MTASGKSLLAAAAAALAAALFSGCETESAATQTATVTPNYARLSKGQSVALSAAGGWNYRWTLSDDTFGYLDKTAGAKVTYTATKEGVTQTVTLQAVFSSDGSSYSQAQATIVQGDEEYAATASGTSTGTSSAGRDDSGGGSGSGSGGGSTGTTFAISRTSLNMDVGDTETLTTTGAKGTVTWTRGNDGVVELLNSAGVASATVKGASVRVRAVKAGVTKVHAADTTGFAPDCTVTVSDADDDEE